MTSDAPDDRNGDDPDDEETAADEESERATLEEVEHTHPHTDETFDRTGVHGRGKRSESEDEDAEEA